MYVTLVGSLLCGLIRYDPPAPTRGEDGDDDDEEDNGWQVAALSALLRVLRALHGLQDAHWYEIALC